MDENIKPIKISESAAGVLQAKARIWTGWPDLTLSLGATGTGSPYAALAHPPTPEMRVNPEHLLRNPNRVLKTVTPFRLRQEALITGAMLHEAGHARHSHWQPGRYGNPAVAVHGAGAIGQPVSDLAMDLALNLEEARVEGLIARDATDIGAHGLAWTMRCSALKVLPLTEVSLDPDQATMDVLTSWILRAGRQISTVHNCISSGRYYQAPEWVSDFNHLLAGVLRSQIERNVEAATPELSENDFTFDSDVVVNKRMEEVTLHLYEAVCADEKADAPGSTYMVDKAQAILDILFPTEEQQEQVGAQSQCAEDRTESDDSDEQDSDEGEDQDEDESPGEGGSGDGDDEADPDDTDGESDDDGQDGEGDTEPSDPGSGTQPGAGDTGQEDAAAKNAALNRQADLQADLEDMEQAAAKQAEQEQKSEEANPSEGPDPTQAGQPEDGAPDKPADDNPQQQRGAGTFRGRGHDVDWRQPVKHERDVKRGAEQFLRNIIDPSEAGKQQITDSPAALVDGAALAAWKAGGQTAAPLFFKRIKRTEQPAPPVKVAILVDRSASMDVLDKPSSLLSWAMASAAIDLRNFAGRGIQVESTLIHWGSDARVIQRNGANMPGIFEGKCRESTAAMHDALELVDQQMPGFFDPQVRNENRLLVQFTDWELSWSTADYSVPWIDRALTNGVNMLSVVPMNYSWRSSNLSDILSQVKRPTGRTALLKYNPDRPDEVWTAAAEVLSGGDSTYGF